jgi:arylsulfatase A-like enzyme
VPLIVVDPQRQRAGHGSRFLAQTHDIAPTLLSLAGLRPPPSMTGTDLSPLLRGRRPRERAFAYGGYANSLYALTDRWKLICANDGSGRRLYDLAHDPGERRNVASRHGGRAEELYAAVVRRTGGRPPVYPHR